MNSPRCLALVLSLTAMAPFMTACGGTQKKKAPPRPSWVDNPGVVKNGLAAVGSSIKGQGDYDKARDRALAELSATVATRLKSVVTVYAEASSENKDYELNAERIDSMTSASISGAKVLAQYRDDEMVYVIVGVAVPSQILSSLEDTLVKEKGQPADAKKAVQQELERINESRKQCGLSR